MKCEMAAEGIAKPASSCLIRKSSSRGPCDGTPGSEPDEQLPVAVGLRRLIAKNRFPDNPVIKRSFGNGRRRRCNDRALAEGRYCGRRDKPERWLESSEPMRGQRTYLPLRSSEQGCEPDGGIATPETPGLAPRVHRQWRQPHTSLWGLSLYCLLTETSPRVHIARGGK
jgi:hypothetical protein